jgi:hypothetical protein
MKGRKKEGKQRKRTESIEKNNIFNFQKRGNEEKGEKITERKKRKRRDRAYIFGRAGAISDQKLLIMELSANCFSE